MGKKSNLKKMRKVMFGLNYNKVAKQLMRKAEMVGYTDRTITGKPYTTIYNPVKRLVKMKPYKSDVAKSILAGTVEKYSNFINAESKKKVDTTASNETNIEMTKEN